jgi:hypothetical protein
MAICDAAMCWFQLSITDKIQKNTMKDGHHIDYVSKHCKDWTPTQVSQNFKLV